jgi:hypothetical protein
VGRRIPPVQPRPVAVDTPRPMAATSPPPPFIPTLAPRPPSRLSTLLAYLTKPFPMRKLRKLNPSTKDFLAPSMSVRQWLRSIFLPKDPSNRFKLLAILPGTNPVFAQKFVFTFHELEKKKIIFLIEILNQIFFN